MLVTSQSLHGSVIDDFDRPLKRGFKVETGPAFSQVVRVRNDPISMDYYLWEEPGQLVTHTSAFRVSGIVPIAANQGRRSTSRDPSNRSMHSSSRSTA